MAKTELSRATLGRIPAYLRYLETLPKATETISATAIAAGLGLGEVQVRKDLSMLCGTGKPKIGYRRDELTKSLAGYLENKNGNAILIGAGQLGRALLDYSGFAAYGISILAAFDKKATQAEATANGKPVLPIEQLAAFCEGKDIRLGIIAVPAQAAQEVCNLLYENGIRAMWCFAPCRLNTPSDAIIRYENLALSLAHLKMQSNQV